MSALTQTGFDYAALPIDAALTARAAAERIKLRLKRTVEDIIEIGRELTAAKEQLPHGQFLPWIAAEFEMSQQTANNFTAVYERFGNGKLPIISNLRPTILYALSAPSTPAEVIDRAVEKADAGEKVTVADVKDWKKELETERKARELAQARADEFRQESNERRIKIRELESQVDFLQSQPPPAPEVVEKIPDDYEAIKRQAAEAAQQLDALKKQQDKIVNDQVKAKLQGYQSELNKLEADKKAIEDIVARKKAYLDSLSGEVKRIETHQAVINGDRLELINLAAFLNDMDPMNDPDTVRKWLALADMHKEAEQAIRSVFQDSTIRRVA
jgi:outer membrane murein-binding lipoprotein Lpp